MRKSAANSNSNKSNNIKQQQHQQQQQRAKAKFSEPSVPSPHLALFCTVFVAFFLVASVYAGFAYPFDLGKSIPGRSVSSAPQTPIADGLPAWGSFRPGIYFGMKSRHPRETMSTGIMWAPTELGREFRHTTTSDEVKYEWITHDGENYGKERIVDRAYGVEINASFIVPPSDGAPASGSLKEPSWAQRISITKSAGRALGRSSLLFYLGVDQLTDASQLRALNVVRHGGKSGSHHGAFSVTGHTKRTGWFCLVLILRGNAAASAVAAAADTTSSSVPASVSLSHTGLAGASLLAGTDRLVASKQSRTPLPQERARGKASLFVQSGDLDGALEIDSSFLALQAAFGGPQQLQSQQQDAVVSLEMDIVFFERTDDVAAPCRAQSSILGRAQTKCSLRMVLNSTAYRGEGVGGDAEVVASIKSDLDRRERALTARFQQTFFEKFPSLTTTTTTTTTNTNTTDGSGGGSSVGGGEFTAEEVGIAQIAVSAVLGGVGFHEGEPRVEEVRDGTAAAAVAENSKSKSILQAKWISLLSTTPSRSVFPRGFLWDEGFHQMLVSRWSVRLSLRVLSSWLDAMSVEETRTTEGEEGGKGANDPAAPYVGWIPREMILGEESLRRVPDEFVTQRSNIANPPTLLLSIESMLQRMGTEPVGLTLDGPDVDAGDGADEQQCDAARPGDCSGTAQASGQLSRAEQRLLLRFLRDNYSLMHLWVQWFLASQRGSDRYPNSFRWRGRSTADGKVVPNTLSSGLDDYPRSHDPTPDEHHVDLLCWIVKATGIMAEVQTTLQRFNVSLPPAAAAQAAAAGYADLHDRLLGSVEALHWSDEYRGYFDVGMHDEENSAFVTYFYFRCQDPSRDERDPRAVVDVAVPLEVARTNDATQICPKPHTEVKFVHNDGSGYKTREAFAVKSARLTHIPRVGYVALFPLLLRLLDAESPGLGATLDMLESPSLLWTEWGLRSISQTDKFYLKRNSPGDAPYWRGPIWIPINYLAVSALHHYGALPGPHQQRARELYARLRRNVVRNVLDEYKRTGFFWEQYQDDTGEGMRGHPFTGWTVLFVNLMAEMY